MPTCFYYLCSTKALSSAKLVSSKPSTGREATVQGQSVATVRLCFKKKKDRGNDSIYLESTRSWFKPQDHKTSNHILLKGICCFISPHYTVSIINCGILSYCFLSSNTKIYLYQTDHKHILKNLRIIVTENDLQARIRLQIIMRKRRKEGGGKGGGGRGGGGGGATGCGGTHL